MAEQQVRPEPGPDTGILVTIRSLLPNLAPVERRVAQAVLDDPQGVAWRSISELARACGTSATSVVRFCRAIGLRGYPDLRLALAGAVARDDATAVTAASHDIDPGDDAATITSKIAYADARAVTETASHLDIAMLVQVTEALAKASRIDIYGVGASGHVALDLQMKLQRIGPGERGAAYPLQLHLQVKGDEAAGTHAVDVDPAGLGQGPGSGRTRCSATRLGYLFALLNPWWSGVYRRENELTRFGRLSHR